MPFFFYLVSVFFVPLVPMCVASAAGKADLMRRSSFAAMYRKEFGRYFDSYRYVLNTGLGVVCLFVVYIAICIISPEMLGDMR